MGRWTLLRRTVFTKRAKWLVRCDCGAVKEVFVDSVIRGRSTSCGCFRVDDLVSRQTTHGESKTRLYRVWASIVSRCTNPEDPAYPKYGGRGITLCSEWRTFEGFKLSVGNKPLWAKSLDRIDNNRGYQPDNVRWASTTTQNRNKRNNRLITYQGRTQCLNAWAEELNINRATLQTRLDREGLTVEEAFTRPSRYKNKKEKIPREDRPV